MPSTVFFSELSQLMMMSCAIIATQLVGLMMMLIINKIIIITITFYCY